MNDLVVSDRQKHNGMTDNKEYIKALEYTKGDREEARKLLGISRAQFYRDIKELNIKLPPRE